MNLNFTNIVRQPNGAWLFSWGAVAGATQYRVCYQGILLAVVTSTSYTYNLPNTGAIPPSLEVVANNALTVGEINPGRIVLQWYGLTAATAADGITNYVVEQYVNGAWVGVAAIAESGQWVYSYTTTQQPDGAVAKYRVRAINSIGQSSTDVCFTQLVVRPPDPPSITVAYTETGNALTISS